MLRHEWLEFTWDLRILPDEKGLSGVRVRNIDVEKEKGALEKLWRVVESSYLSDDGWITGGKERIALLEGAVRKGELSGGKQLKFIGLEAGKRFVGASGFDVDKESPRQLVTGVCVLNEYRCRGYGESLLLATLRALQEEGLATASVITKSNLVAAKYLYPKFKSRVRSLGEVKPSRLDKEGLKYL